MKGHNNLSCDAVMKGFLFSWNPITSVLSRVHNPILRAWLRVQTQVDVSSPASIFSQALTQACKQITLLFGFPGEMFLLAS